MYVLKEVCYLTTPITVIHFFYGSVIISQVYLKWSIFQGHCVYFTKLVAAVHYKKRSVVDSRKFEGYPAGIYQFKVNNRNTRARCEIYSKLTVQTLERGPERHHCRCSGVFIVNFRHISHLVLVFLLLTLNM